MTTAEAPTVRASFENAASFRIVVDRMREGWLVRGATSREEALRVLQALGAEDITDACPTRLGWYRKVPAQWSDWALHDAEENARGAFSARIVYTDGRVSQPGGPGPLCAACEQPEASCVGLRAISRGTCCPACEHPKPCTGSCPADDPHGPGICGLWHGA